jgi:hypothetical protein
MMNQNSKLQYLISKQIEVSSVSRFKYKIERIDLVLIIRVTVFRES